MTSEFERAIQNCNYVFSEVPFRRKTGEILQDLLAYANENKLADLAPDMYGNGIVSLLENRVKDLFGFENAVYFPSGTMAQQIALKYWSNKKTAKKIAVHRDSHPLIFENDAMSQLAGLTLVPISDSDLPLLVKNLEFLDEEIGTLMLEIPLRDAGYQMTSYEEMEKIVRRSKELNLAVHIDGARIWEAAGYWEKPLNQLRSLADSMYVSFYKSLGATSGAMLLCDSDLAEYAIEWRHRYGGRIFQQFPAIISALRGIDSRLPRIQDYVQKAREASQVLSAAFNVPGVPRWQICPQVPHINQFQIRIDLPRKILNEITVKQAEEKGCSFFSSPWWEITNSGPTSVADISVDEPGLLWSEAMIWEISQDFISRIKKISY